ncbi:MAG: histidine kinase [Pseudomonadota bacterium]
MQIINQNKPPHVLPNFRSLGVVLRIVLLINGMALLAALMQATAWSDVLQHMLSISTFMEPVLLSSLLLLFITSPLLPRLIYREGALAVMLIVAAITIAIYQLGGELYAPTPNNQVFNSVKYALLAMVAAAALLTYFRVRAQALSPALHEARLQALQARIRPHFLFNSINAVLGIVRADPKRAETALEDMADLFRTAMASSAEMVPARQELALARQYLALEKLRLGDRLQVNWHIDNLPDDTLLLPLMVQPLLENAVYHGIEPLTEGGAIDIRLYRSGGEIHLEMYNPRQPQSSEHIGNRMALANIRERLALQFDLEARYTVETGMDFYRVHIIMPYIAETKHDDR